MAGSMRTLAQALARTGGLLAVAIALGAGAAVPAAAKPDTAQDAPSSAASPPEPTKPLPERARAVLEAHCPACRDASGVQGAPLDLDTIATNPRLVTPKRPDASRIYQQLLAQQSLTLGQAKEPAQREGNGKKAEAGGTGKEPDAETAAPPVPGPATPGEIETVRDWIESLPARDEACHDRAVIGKADMEAQIDRWMKAAGEAKAADTRFVALAHLWNACTTPARMKEFRDAAATFLQALARRNGAMDIETVGEESAILTFRLSEFHRPADEEDVLIDPPPTVVSGDAIPIDWFAAQFLGNARPGGALERMVKSFDGAALSAAEELARSWNGDVDLLRAAAERGLPPADLANTLSKMEGDLLLPARRLLHGVLTRAAWNRLAAALDGRRPTDEAATAPAADEIDVVLWTDKPAYRPRDLVTLNASVSTACHLTLINVDKAGKAIVLFPNELEPENLVAPSVTIQVPGHDAGYQLRFDESGEEEIVAICQRKRRDPLGIAYDYEKQRFAVLGDWRTFLRTAPEREREVRAREAAENARRTRRRGRSAPVAPPEAAAVDPEGPAIEGRAAIYVPIAPAGMANR